MQKLIWQNANGESVDLTQAPYGITNWEGFSNTSLNIQSQQVPFQDGGVFLDALIEQRELSITLAMQDNNDLEARYRMRRELIHILNPKLGEGYLIYTNDFISKRIKCVAQIPLFETHNSNDSGTPKASLAWTACEPYWEDVEETLIGFSRGEVEVENKGDVECPVEIQITTSSNTNLQIENKTSGKFIGLNGVSDTIKILTNNGQKQVMGQKIDTTYFQQKDIHGVVYDSSLRKYIYETATVAYSSNLNVLVRYAYNSSYGSGVEKSIDGENWTFFPISDLEGRALIKIKWIAEIQKFVGVTYATVAISDDGENWTVTRFPDNFYNHYRAVGYAKWNGDYVLIIGGDRGCYAISEDGGNTWQEDVLQDVSESIMDIINEETDGSDGTIFVGTHGFIYWGGIIASGVTDNLNSIVYNNSDGCFYIAGENGVILKTSDFYTIVNLEIEYEQDFNSIIYTEETGFFTIVGNGIILQGNTIESLSRLFYNYGVEFNSIKYFKKLEKFFLWNSKKIVTTKDFVTYEDFYEEQGNRTIVQLEFGNGIYIIVFYDMLGHSTNGEDWEYTSFQGYNLLVSGAYGIEYSEKYKRFYLAYDYGNKIGYTLDGTNIVELYAGDDIAISGFCYADSIDVLVIMSSKIGFGFYSTDGGDTIHSISIYGNAPHFMAIAWSEELKMFIAGGHDSAICTSKDGKNWYYASNPYNSDTYNITDSDFGGFFLNGGLSSSHEIGFTTDAKSYQFIDITNTYSIASGKQVVCALGRGSPNGALVIIQIVDGNNQIEKLTENSNMDFYLKQGKNKITLSANKDSYAILKYRQKYIGV